VVGVAAGLVGAVLSACGANADTLGETKSSMVEVVTVAAAADLRYALDEVIVLVTRDSPNVEVRVTYGSSGQFLQQIQSGAPFDIYLSADLAYPQQLVASGRAEEADLFSYAIGRLALWVPEGSPMDPSLGLEILRDPQVQRIAIANPEHAPYGRAAVQAITTAGVLADVEERFILGENVAQAAEFVASGNADAGIVAISLVLSDPLRGVGTWSEIPESDFARIDQGGLVLTDSPGAWKIRDALLSPAGREILDRYGFRQPQGV
jgi:molybdate transport system substrate-binding protein